MPYEMVKVYEKVQVAVNLQNLRWVIVMRTYCNVDYVILHNVYQIVDAVVVKPRSIHKDEGSLEIINLLMRKELTKMMLIIYMLTIEASINLDL